MFSKDHLGELLLEAALLLETVHVRDIAGPVREKHPIGLNKKDKECWVIVCVTIVILV